MKFKKLFICTFACLFCSSIIMAQEHYIPKARNLSKNSYDLNFHLDSHTSTTRFDENGQEKSFLNGESFSQTQAEMSGGFGWREEIELRAGIRYRVNGSDFNNSGQVRSLSNSGLESAFFRAQYAISKKHTKRNFLNFFMDYRQALYSNSSFDPSNTSAVMNLGDAQREINFGMNFFYATKSKFKGFDFGISYLNNSLLSDQIKYRALGVFENGRLALTGGLIGKVALGEASALAQTFTGSTFLYNRQGQSLMSAKAQAIYRLSTRWRLSLGYEKDLSATSTDLGSRFLIALNYRVESKYRQRRRIEKFKNYNIEAIIEKVSSQQNYVIVDKGFVHGVQRGMVFDFFSYDFKGGNKLLARGVVAKTRSKQSAIKIVEWFSASKKFDDNVIARGDSNR